MKTKLGFKITFFSLTPLLNIPRKFLSNREKVKIICSKWSDSFLDATFCYISIHPHTQSGYEVRVLKNHYSQHLNMKFAIWFSNSTHKYIAQ